VGPWFHLGGTALRMSLLITIIGFFGARVMVAR
jgi:hypothetical protein